eukprot:m.121032 g.121032  ORF g.121032 m.121032 type:complete len:98 (-) comp9596_c0_seq3:78-371(-)
MGSLAGTTLRPRVFPSFLVSSSNSFFCSASCGGVHREMLLRTRGLVATPDQLRELLDALFQKRVLGRVPGSLLEAELGLPQLFLVFSVKKMTHAKRD